MKKYNIGVDIGASHISCGLYNIYEKRLEHKIYLLNKMDKTIEIEKYDKYINSFEGLSKRYNRIKNKKYARTEIFRCIEKNDIDAKILLQEYIRNFIGGIKKIESVYGIGKYSIGGGMSEYDNYFFDKIKENLPGIDIRIAKYKNDSGIIGATMLEYIQ